MSHSILRKLAWICTFLIFIQLQRKQALLFSPVSRIQLRNSAVLRQGYNGGTARCRAVFSTAIDETLNMQLNTNQLSESLLTRRTNECLDFSLLLEHLADQAITTKGKEMVKTVKYNSAAEINRAYSMMEELSGQLALLPLRSKLDVWPVLKMIEQNSALPDREELATFATNIEELCDLQQFIKDYRSVLTLFGDIEERLSLPNELVKGFRDSFIEDFKLNPVKFPKIRELTNQIIGLTRQITSTLMSVLNSPAMKDKIADK